MAILSKGCKPDNFELHNSLMLSFTNIQFLHSNFDYCDSAANKYYSFASHHEQKNKKTNSQIKFSAVTIRQKKTSLTIFSM